MAALFSCRSFYPFTVVYVFQSPQVSNDPGLLLSLKKIVKMHVQLNYPIKCYSITPWFIIFSYSLTPLTIWRHSV